MGGIVQNLDQHNIFLGVFYFIIVLTLLEYNCFTLLCQFLLHKQSESAVRMHITPYPFPLVSPSHPPYPTALWSKSTELISLCYAAASHQLSVLHLVVYICPCHSLTSSQLTLPPPHVLKSVLYVCIFIPVLPLGSSDLFFFRFHIHVLAYSICYSLSDLLHSV